MAIIGNTRGFIFGDPREIESSTYDEIARKWVIKLKLLGPEFRWMHRLPPGCSWVISNENWLYIRDAKGHLWLYEKRGRKHGAVPQFLSWYDMEKIGTDDTTILKRDVLRQRVYGPCHDFRRWKPLRKL